MARREDYLRKWIEAGDKAQAEAFARLARPTGPGRVQLLDYGILFSTGLPSRTFNGLSVTSLPKNPKNVISSAQEFFEKLRVPWSLAGRVELIEKMKLMIASAGLREYDSEPGMILDSLDGESTSPPEELVIKRVKAPSEIRNCFLTMAAGYEIPPDALAPLLEEQVLRAYSEDPALNFHIGYVDGNPAGSSVGVASDLISYVFMVSTVPEYRRRGFGEALTRSTVRAGKERGCVTSYLRATEMGRPLYEHMGFREVTRHISFSL